MKKSQEILLQLVYQSKEIPVRDLLNQLNRQFNDHRDFYDLVALLHEGYVGFTGPVLDDVWIMTKTFQCYSQGTGAQHYQGVSILGSATEDSKIYLRSKTIAYIDERNQRRRDLFIVAIVSIVTTIVADFLVEWLTK